MKSLEKRSWLIKEENPEADEVSMEMKNLQELKNKLEDSMKMREINLNSVTNQNNILKEEIKSLSKSLQRLNNELCVDCQVKHSGSQGLKNVADIAQVYFYLLHLFKN